MMAWPNLTRHCERSEAIQRAASAAHMSLMPRRRAADWIATSAFGLLAMTSYFFC